MNDGEVFRKPKKVTTWRTCPNCGSRATKIFNMNTGKYGCQVCKHQYDPSLHEGRA